jgi:hypothetical protein
MRMIQCRTDAQLIARAAAEVAAAGRHWSIDRRDLVQIGWLAALEAQAAGRLPDAAPHREAYLTLRTRGAMRDACARARREIPEAAPINDDITADDAPGPEFAAHLRGQARRFEADPCATPRMRQALRLLLAGHSTDEMAAQMGCSWSGVSQFLARVDWLMAMRR